MTELKAMTEADETPLDPGRPIIDPHMHLWEILPAPGQPQAPQRFLLDECRAAIATSAHAITHTVFVECHQMYRADGAETLRSVGETEFANGIAATSASGLYGDCRIAHRIVGSIDLRLGAQVAPVLEAHVRAADARFRGIRMATAWRETSMFGTAVDPTGRGIVADPRFVEGARVLAAMDLSLDIWCFDDQLNEVIALADAVPDLAIVVDHCGTPDHAGANEAPPPRWAAHMADLARRPNVAIKLGGLGMRLDRPVGAETHRAASTELAARWRMRIEPLIECFGADRCMFESNFPPDADSGSYGATWNAFKRIAAGCSEDEKDALFRRTAARFYRIAL